MPQVRNIQDVYPLSARKRGIDGGSPWWKRTYFNWVYMPFIRFSFKRFHVPYPKEAAVEAYAYPNYELVPIPRRLLTKISTEIREEVRRVNEVLGTP